jgi:YcxB-like protein
MNSLVEAGSERLTYTWDWTRAEHIRVHKALSREVWRRGLLRIVRAVFFLGIGAGALVPLYLAFRGDATLLIRVLPWLLMIGLWLSLFTWILPRSSARAHLKLHRGPQRLAISPDALESGCDTCSNQLRWSAIQRVVETPEFFFLFYTPQCAYYLPKQVLRTPAEQERVRIALRTYLPEQAAFATA